MAISYFKDRKSLHKLKQYYLYIKIHYNKFLLQINSDSKMSVVVNQISKFYQEQKALDNVSFEIRKGEISGFLGPNGAGKSTMMKIICGYIPPSSGRVSVCGLDVFENSMEVKKKVGYLPEHNPLYSEMYVKEYLEFIAGIHHIAQPRTRIDEMIDMTGLGDEKKKKISELSKGYKQRVGLAQALIHNPEVLILDEPSSGLDPNQLNEIRSLIKNIGKEKTVILSTHIMQEVKAICDRVIIINKGKIVADESTDILQQNAAGETTVFVEFDNAIEKEKLERIHGVSRVTDMGKNKWKITSQNNIDIRADVFKLAVQNGIAVLSQHREEKSLEDIFRSLTAVS